MFNGLNNLNIVNGFNGSTSTPFNTNHNPGTRFIDHYHFGTMPTNNGPEDTGRQFGTMDADSHPPNFISYPTETGFLNDTELDLPDLLAVPGLNQPKGDQTKGQSKLPHSSHYEQHDPNTTDPNITGTLLTTPILPIASTPAAIQSTVPNLSASLSIVCDSSLQIPTTNRDPEPIKKGPEQLGQFGQLGQIGQFGQTGLTEKLKELDLLLDTLSDQHKENSLVYVTVKQWIRNQNVIEPSSPLHRPSSSSFSPFMSAPPSSSFTSVSLTISQSLGPKDSTTAKENKTEKKLFETVKLSLPPSPQSFASTPPLSRPPSNTFPSTPSPPPIYSPSASSASPSASSPALPMKIVHYSLPTRSTPFLTARLPMVK